MRLRFKSRYCCYIFLGYSCSHLHFHKFHVQLNVNHKKSIHYDYFVEKEITLSLILTLPLKKAVLIINITGHVRHLFPNIHLAKKIWPDLMALIQLIQQIKFHISYLFYYIKKKHVFTNGYFSIFPSVIIMQYHQIM